MSTIYERSHADFPELYAVRVTGWQGRQGRAGLV